MSRTTKSSWKRFEATAEHFKLSTPEIQVRRQRREIVFPNGCVLQFRAVRGERDADRLRGVHFDHVDWDSAVDPAPYLLATKG